MNGTRRAIKTIGPHHAEDDCLTQLSLHQLGASQGRNFHTFGSQGSKVSRFLINWLFHLNIVYRLNSFPSALFERVLILKQPSLPSWTTLLVLIFLTSLSRTLLNYNRNYLNYLLTNQDFSTISKPIKTIWNSNLNCAKLCLREESISCFSIKTQIERQERTGQNLKTEWCHLIPL